MNEFRNRDNLIKVMVENLNFYISIHMIILDQLYSFINCLSQNVTWDMNCDIKIEIIVELTATLFTLFLILLHACMLRDNKRKSATYGFDIQIHNNTWMGLTIGSNFHPLLSPLSCKFSGIYLGWNTIP